MKNHRQMSSGKSQMEWAELALKKIKSMPREELFESLRKAGLIEDIIPLFRVSEEAIAASFPEHTLVAIGYPLQHLVYRVGKGNVLHFSYHVSK